jgi:hypothetical protein
MVILNIEFKQKAKSCPFYFESYKGECGCKATYEEGKLNTCSITNCAIIFWLKELKIIEVEIFPNS